MDFLVRQWLLVCIHCRLSNTMDHSTMAPLQEISSEEPFDVIFMDVWVPGEVL